MSTKNFKSAKIFVDGYDLAGDFNEIGVELTAEMLDETSFGDSTRIHKGGLTVATIAGKGNVDAADGHVERVMFGIVGTDDKIITVFADGITEGTTTDKGFSMKGVVETYNIGGAVGALLPFDFSIQGRGIEA